MKKAVALFLILGLFSCSNKEVQLVPLDTTVVATVQDYSPIYLFFETNGKDTLIEVNRNNAISSTNWLFHVDKRLPLRLVVPEIQKMQHKKAKSSHQKKGTENYFTYMNNQKKTLAFLPFTGLRYSVSRPRVDQKTIYFTATNSIVFNRQVISKQVLVDTLRKERGTAKSTYFLGFDANMSFEKYLHTRLEVKKWSAQLPGIRIRFDQEFVY